MRNFEQCTTIYTFLSYQCVLHFSEKVTAFSVSGDLWFSCQFLLFKTGMILLAVGYSLWIKLQSIQTLKSFDEPLASSLWNLEVFTSSIFKFLSICWKVQPLVNCNDRLSSYYLKKLISDGISSLKLLEASTSLLQLCIIKYNSVSIKKKMKSKATHIWKKNITNFLAYCR